MIVKGSLLQSGANVFTAGTVETNLQIDGKSGWLISGFRVFNESVQKNTPADMRINVALSTIATQTAMNSLDEIARVTWSLQYDAGTSATTTTIAVSHDLIKTAVFLEPRLTVQPQIYVQISSEGSGQVSQIYYEINYDLVKLTDVELLRLMVGGA